MSRKKQRLVIRNSANLTDQMRKERQAETFEEMSTAQSKESTTSTESIRQKRKTATTKRTIRIQKERIVKYEADLVSGYERSENTQSMDSISEPENIEEFEKKCGESKHIGPQLIPIKFVATDVETPVQAIFVSDFDLCEAMHHPKPNSTQSKKVEFSKRFEVEQKFLEELVTDIEKLLVTSGRMDVELKVVKTREPNGTPHGKISLIRKMKAEKPGTNLSKTHGLHGFAPSEILMKDSEFHGNDKEKITKIQKIPEGFNVYKSFKRLFGY